MSFPCQLRLHAADPASAGPAGHLRLSRWPVSEIVALRTNTHQWLEREVKPGENLCQGMNLELADLEAEVDLDEAAGFGFRVRGELVSFDPKTSTLQCLGASAPLRPEHGRLSLRILVDRSSIEVFANGGRVSMTSCFLPKQKARQLETVATGKPARIKALRVHQLRSTWTHP